MRELKEQMESADQLMEDASSSRRDVNAAKMYGDENFCKKFGYLKKGCVLMFYGRYNDAFAELGKAVQIIQLQEKLEKERQELIKSRWCFKLGLEDNFEIPF